MDDIQVSFPGGRRVDATIGAHVIRSDQPVAFGGQDSAPAPFDLFLASLATCAGFYVLAFCSSRGISTEGLTLTQHHVIDPTTKHLASVTLEVGLPEGFPERYRDAVLRAAEGCKVKKLLAHPPAIAVVAGSCTLAAGSSSARVA
jgi:ribosomal protein S12 methylthiotransferase accessory factor